MKRKIATRKKERQQVEIVDMPQIEITKEAETKLSTLIECLDLDNESTVINELFYKFVLDQEPDKRKMIMAVYQMNVKNSTEEQHQKAVGKHGENNL